MWVLRAITLIFGAIILTIMLILSMITVLSPKSASLRSFGVGLAILNYMGNHDTQHANHNNNNNDHDNNNSNNIVIIIVE